jgi:hypothetical protein
MKIDRLEEGTSLPAKIRSTFIIHENRASQPMLVHGRKI